MNADGAGQTILTNISNEVENIRFSPDGSKIVYDGYNSGTDTWNIWLYSFNNVTPISYNWFVKKAVPGGFDGGTSRSAAWGDSNDIPIVGDFNGDGKADIGIYHTGSYPNWFFLPTKSDGSGFMGTQNNWSLSWGNAGGDLPIVGDFNGDGKTDIGIFRISGYPNWFTNNSNGNGFTQKADTVSSWGNPNTDRPIIGDFNGDGSDDLGIYRHS